MLIDMWLLSKQIKPELDSGLNLLPLACKGERFPTFDPELEPILEPRPVSDAKYLHALLEGLALIEAKGWKRLQNLGVPTFIPSHPRLVKKCEEFGINLAKGNLIPVEPLSYRELITTALSSAHIVTDSGGLQKEAFHLGTPCTTVRTETEWPETLSGGWNELAEPSKIGESILRQAPNTNRGAPFGNGDAAGNISQLLKEI